MTLVVAGDEVVLAAPYFLNHEMAVRSVGAIPIEAPAASERRFQTTWDDLAPHITIRTRAVVLVTPSNPTGAIVPRSDLQRIVDECASRDVIVIVDETYLQFVYDAAPFTAAALGGWNENVVVIGSFSKAYAITGWRCGYLLAHPDAISEATKIHDCMLICAPVPVQHAVAAVLEQEPDYPKRWLRELKDRRDYLVEALGAIAGLRPVVPSGGFFVMVRIAPTPDVASAKVDLSTVASAKVDSRATAMQLIEERQVVTIPGRFFGESGEGYLRISYGAATIDRLRDAVGRLTGFFAR
jgi:aminotransferase